MQASKRLFSFVLFPAAALLLAASVCSAEPVEITVAADGTGDFRMIQSALESLPVDGREPVVISIRNGLYYEKVRINRDRVTLRGESRDGVRIEYYLPRSEYDRRYDALGPAVVNVFGDDVVIENLTIKNTQPDRTHAFALYGQPNRFILRDCDVLGEGGDTVSLWNTSFGMYYHLGCRFRGGVDFVCPRGWCYIRDSQFECPTTSAAIWQDGHMDPDMKFVLRGCSFDGTENFWLGRNHYPSQFYLLDCTFGENMADKPIGVVGNYVSWEDPAVYERKYFFNCHRTGGDYAWFADNLQQAAGSPREEEITAKWTFDGRWDPEGTASPTVQTVEVVGDLVHVYCSEDVAGVRDTRVVRKDGTPADYLEGSGTRHLVFRGGSAGLPPERFDFRGDTVVGTVASLDDRQLTDTRLPAAVPRRQVTVVLVGDSTVADYDAGHPCRGWGQAIAGCFDDRVRVANWARNGRSSKSFRDEGWWDKAMREKPDYVFIQFGHNDNPGKGPKRETDPAPGGTYRVNLQRYVDEARQAGAVPVLVSPTTRRFYDESAKINPSEKNVPYAEATLAVAKELECPVIDLNTLTRDLFNRLGEEHSHWMQPVGDRTHFTPPGARRVAGLVIEALRSAVPELAAYLDEDAAQLRRRPIPETPAADMYEPLAPKFWIPEDTQPGNPPEELLYPDGTPGVLDVSEKADNRATGHLNRWVSGIREPTISIHRPTGEQQSDSAVVVCPGGGYAGLAYDKEGHDVARWLNSLGVTAVVLKYRVQDYGQPAPLDDAARAIATVRSRAAELGVDPDKIGVMGFSAGGHVASTAGTHFRDVEIKGKKVSSRPDFMLLIYPVISMDASITHRGSRDGLLGSSPSDELVREYSNDLQVTGNTPPTFLVHAADDGAVSIENSLRMMRALQKNRVPAEMAVYEHGGHGFGLVFDPIPAAQWPLRCEKWLQRQGLLEAPQVTAGRHGVPPIQGFNRKHPASGS